ncbi:hypothetical protein R6Q59_004244, partial [Mikania micrantha]
DKGLESTYMGKTVKVVYNGTMIRFTLPLSAEFTYLHWEVTKRFTQLQYQIFRVEYNTTEGLRLPILSDDDLRRCMAESSSRGEKFIIIVNYMGDAYGFDKGEMTEILFEFQILILII